MDDTDRNYDDSDEYLDDGLLEEDAEVEDELEGLDNLEDEPGSEYL